MTQNEVFEILCKNDWVDYKFLTKKLKITKSNISKNLMRLRKDKTINILCKYEPDSNGKKKKYFKLILKGR